MPRRPSEVDPSWGAVQDPRRDVVVVTIAENGVRLPVHKDIAFVVVYCLRSAWASNYRSWHKGNTWGLAVRTIRGSDSVWSAHAYGTAVDVASDLNPMRSPLRTDMPAWLPVLFEAWGFRWGGRWTRRPDPMHFSYAGTRADAARLNEIAARLLFAGTLGLNPAGNPVTPIAHTKELLSMFTVDVVRLVELQYVEKGQKMDMDGCLNWVAHLTAAKDHAGLRSRVNDLRKALKLPSV